MNTDNINDDLKSEYNFSKMKFVGKGKYSQKYKAGTNIIHLAPDVVRVFHDDESVNNALRILIEIAKKQVDQYNL